MNEPRATPGGGGSLEADLQRLEAIVTALESDQLDLDGALALFEEGVARLKEARGRLAAAEIRLSQLRETAGGEIRVDSLSR